MANLLVKIGAKSLFINKNCYIYIYRFKGKKEMQFIFLSHIILYIKYFKKEMIFFYFCKYNN